MYRIQAFDTIDNNWVVFTLRDMQIKNDTVQKMKDSGQYLSISVEWLKMRD